MKKIGKILLLDFKSISKNLIIFVVVIGITILPALYAWFNIASNWDPYSNTGELPFAVCSLDKGSSFKNIEVDAGAEIIENLKGNNKMGWQFVDEDEAVEGVKSGKYYAAVVIPEDFSENLLSVATGKFKQAELQYYVNEKKNAIAPKITDKGIEALEESVNASFVGTLTKTIAAALNITTEELEGEKDALADKITSALNNAKEDVASFNDSIDLLVATLDSIDKLIQSNRDLKPVIEEAFNSAGVFLDDIKSLISSIKSTAGQLTGVIENLVTSGESFMDSATTQFDDAFAEMSGDAKAFAAKIKRIETINQRIIAVNNKLVSILETIQSDLGIDCSKLINKLEEATDKQQAIIDKIDSVCDTIEQTGQIPADVQSEFDALLADAKTEITDVESEFNSIKNDIDSALTESFDSMDGIADFAQSISLGDSGLDNVLKEGSATVEDLKNVLLDLKKYLTNLTERIDNAVARVEKLHEDETLEGLIMPIIKDPAALGEFISAPVSYNENRMYTLSNYGSAMTPFYSSLALWVGGIVLVAVLNVDLSEDDRKKLGKANSIQLFFGRYLIFFILGQIQALIIALGDLFFLQIDCENKLLFVLTCMLSSLVYTLLIYSLTITFSVIGKALAVIILVIQIAGSGGTFPIEVLPGPFKALSPYMPFKYGINALRETVAGVDTGAYLKYIGILALFIIPALILGLLLRQPCIKIIAFFNRKIEDSDLVI